MRSIKTVKTLCFRWRTTRGPSGSRTLREWCRSWLDNIPINFISINPIYDFHLRLKRRHFCKVTDLNFVRCQLFLITSPHDISIIFLYFSYLHKQLRAEFFSSVWLLEQKFPRPHQTFSQRYVTLRSALAAILHTKQWDPLESSLTWDYDYCKKLHGSYKFVF